MMTKGWGRWGVLIFSLLFCLSFPSSGREQQIAVLDTELAGRIAYKVRIRSVGVGDYLESLLLASGLPMIERRQLRMILGERRLLKNGTVDRSSLVAAKLPYATHLILSKVSSSKSRQMRLTVSVLDVQSGIESGMASFETADLKEWPDIVGKAAESLQTHLQQILDRPKLERKPIPGFTASPEAAFTFYQGMAYATQGMIPEAIYYFSLAQKMDRHFLLAAAWQVRLYRRVGLDGNADTSGRVLRQVSTEVKQIKAMEKMDSLRKKEGNVWLISSDGDVPPAVVAELKRHMAQKLGIKPVSLSGLRRLVAELDLGVSESFDAASSGNVLQMVDCVCEVTIKDRKGGKVLCLQAQDAVGGQVILNCEQSIGQDPSLAVKKLIAGGVDKTSAANEGKRGESVPDPKKSQARRSSFFARELRKLIAKPDDYHALHSMTSAFRNLKVVNYRLHMSSLFSDIAARARSDLSEDAALWLAYSLKQEHYLQKNFLSREVYEQMRLSDVYAELHEYKKGALADNLAQIEIARDYLEAGETSKAKTILSSLIQNKGFREQVGTYLSAKVVLEKDMGDGTRKAASFHDIDAFWANLHYLLVEAAIQCQDFDSAAQSYREASLFALKVMSYGGAVDCFSLAWGYPHFRDRTWELCCFTGRGPPKSENASKLLRETDTSQYNGLLGNLAQYGETLSRHGKDIPDLERYRKNAGWRAQAENALVLPLGEAVPIHLLSLERAAREVAPDERVGEILLVQIARLSLAPLTRPDKDRLRQLVDRLLALYSTDEYSLKLIKAAAGMHPFPEKLTWKTDCPESFLAKWPDLRVDADLLYLDRGAGVLHLAIEQRVRYWLASARRWHRHVAAVLDELSPYLVSSDGQVLLGEELQRCKTRTMTPRNLFSLYFTMAEHCIAKKRPEEAVQLLQVAVATIVTDCSSSSIEKRLERANHYLEKLRRGQNVTIPTLELSPVKPDERKRKRLLAMYILAIHRNHGEKVFVKDCSDDDVSLLEEVAKTRAGEETASRALLELALDAFSRGDNQAGARRLDAISPIYAAENSLLHRCARKGQVQAIKHLLENGENVNRRYRKTKSTPLFSAIRGGQRDAFLYLMAMGADINALDDELASPLRCATRNTSDSFFALTLIADLRCKLDDADDEGWTPFHSAVRYKRAEVAKVLLQRGVDVNKRTALLWTPLHMACLTGQPEIASLIIAKGGDIEAKNKWGRTPLYKAAQYNSLPCVRLLLENGAMPDVSWRGGWTPLLYAAHHNYSEMVELLIKHGADVDVTKCCEEKCTPLIHAAQQNGLATVRVLLDNGADAKLLRTNRIGPVYWAAARGNAEMIRLLQKAGADINAAKKPNSYTPLHVAIEEGHVDCARCLIGLGADPEFVDDRNMNALRSALRYDRPEIAKFLMAKGFEPGESKDQWNELHLAVRYTTSLDVIKALLSSGKYDLAKGVNDGYTPLHLAAHIGDPVKVRLLLDAGAPVDSVTEKGKRPSQLIGDMISMKQEGREPTKKEMEEVRQLLLEAEKKAGIQ